MPESATLPFPAPSAAPTTAQSFVEQFGALRDQLPGAGLPWLQELREDGIARWSRPSGWSVAFCRTCGCPAPLLHPSGKLYWVPAGLLDDDPGVGIGQHIFVGSKAAWDVIPEGAPRFEEGRPPDTEIADSAP